ncbi:hypothetical protein OPV22_023921 [Ensete ventricosum]|uniref:Cation/H+ exchanger transmembrane domain-containing protein n=1 Tax=Ensete ventricosum TaxID=4639 RepID=A0AAV8QTB1_ENSVE|nr:hypothetical protein OPV22_023921 [Ensete ventricosum]
MAGNGAFHAAVCDAPADDNNLFSDGGVFYGDDPFGHVMPLFMLHIVVIVFTSRAVYLLLRPLRQPRLVCDIISGVLLGPTLPSLLSRLLSFFHRVFAMEGAPDYSHIKQRYMDAMFRTDNVSLMRSVASYGFMLQLFLISVKTDPSNIWRCGKKAFAIGVSCMVMPFAVLNLLSWFFEVQHVPDDGGRTVAAVAGVGDPNALVTIASLVSDTMFPVVAEILAELRLLNTELGRLALSVSMIIDYGWSLTITIATVVMRTMYEQALPLVYSALGIVAMIVFLLFVFRPWVRWIVRQTPKDGRIAEGQVLMVLLVVMAMGAVSETFGARVTDGPIIMGLLVPSASPLAVAIAEKVEVIATGLMLPLAFLNAGMLTDFSTIEHPKVFLGLQLFMLAGYVIKFFAAMAPAVYYNMPVGKAALLGLMLNFTGLMQLLIYVDSLYSQVIQPEAYAAIIVVIVAVTAICSYLVAKLYDPLTPNKTVAYRKLKHLD